MISNLVSNLPEVYQPIYGHPELSGQVSRPCQDRLEKIAQAHDALQRLLGRPLNVLDLGCAQGYFSLSLAERGASVHGVDYLDKNIAVCSALAQAHPQLKASFETGRVEDAIARLEPGQYDLVLGLSVFHHIVHEKGVEAVKGFLERAANQSGVLIVELALHEEPLYWASSQPQDLRTLLEPIAFVHEVARHETHLAPIPRPLYVASNRYWLLDGRAGQFDTWSTDPHAIAHGTHERSRRYFFSADAVLKLYRFDHSRGAHNKSEFTREKQFLQSPPPGFPVPACTVVGENKTEGWLVMERLPGKLLLELLREGAHIDRRAVLLAVLGQLAALEAAGLYHDDVRTWNVLVAEDGAVHLIDYGSISSKKQDCVWPGNPFLAFFIFVREVATGVVDDPDPLRTVSISPYGLPQPYCTWATSLWRRSLAEWSFQLMHETLLQTPANLPDEPPQQPIEAWMKATEEAIQAQKLYVKHAVQQIEARTQQAEAKAEQAEAKAEQAEAKAEQAEAKAEQAEAKAQQADAKAQHAEIALIAMHDSSSWRLTAPLRIISSMASHLFKLPKAAKLKSKEKTKLLLAHAKLYIYRRPRFRRAALAILVPFPALKRRLKLMTSTLKSQQLLASQQPPNRVHSELDSTTATTLQASLLQAAARWQLGRRKDV